MNHSNLSQKPKIRFFEFLHYIAALFLIVLFFYHCTVLAHANNDKPTIYNGKVVKIMDGDTVGVLVNHKMLKIRLAGIDAPEYKQPYGHKSKQALANMVFRKNIRVVQTDIDHYHRIVAKLYLNGEDINRKMVQQGYAWVYRKYNNDPSMLLAEKQARHAKRGIWSLPKHERVPPWKWRWQERQLPKS